MPRSHRRLHPNLQPLAQNAQRGLDLADVAAMERVAKPPYRLLIQTNSTLETPAASIASWRASFAATNGGTIATGRPRAADGAGSGLASSV
jgi:hypothetical protein